MPPPPPFADEWRDRDKPVPVLIISNQTFIYFLLVTLFEVQFVYREIMICVTCFPTKFSRDAVQHPLPSMFIKVFQLEYNTPVHICNVYTYKKSYY